MDLNAVEAFVRVGDARSFTAAANQMGLTASGVSKAIARLEGELGVKLLHRTTRSLSLTADGAIFLDRCRQVLSDLNDARLALSQTASEPRGRLRVSMPVALGRLIVIPGLVRLRGRYPELVIEASVTDRHIDLVEEGFDAAIRIGELPDSGLIARRLAGTRWVTCAAPAYLDRFGHPATLEELEGHERVIFVSRETGRVMPWVFNDGGTRRIGPGGGGFTVDNGEALVDAALAGGGIIYIHSYMVSHLVADGRLQSILDAFAAPGPGIHVVYPSSRHLSPKVRAFLDLAGELFPPGRPSSGF